MPVVAHYSADFKAAQGQPWRYGFVNLNQSLAFKTQDFDHNMQYGANGWPDWWSGRSDGPIVAQYFLHVRFGHGAVAAAAAWDCTSAGDYSVQASFTLPDPQSNGADVLVLLNQSVIWSERLSAGGSATPVLPVALGVGDVVVFAAWDNTGNTDFDGIRFDATISTAAASGLLLRRRRMAGGMN